MDHLIDDFDIHIEWATDSFIKEWKSGKYRKYKECPSYTELKALIDSVNILRVYIGMEKITVKGIVEFYCE
ncbi:MAG: hypothetical protein E6929_07800 [Clostridium sp.]|nr:hypothetical protein [Clostridium sp.]